MVNSLLINSSTIFTYVILGVLVVAIVVMFIFSSRKRKKQEQDAKDLIDSVKPGNKVKTIGGICGIVVEVDSEENTFVLETGTEQSGKCFIKFDKQAIYQTDAVVEKAAAKEEKTEEKPEETSAPAEPFAEEAAAPAEAVEAAPVEVAEVAEATEPADTASEPAKKTRKNKKQ